MSRCIRFGACDAAIRSLPALALLVLVALSGCTSEAGTESLTITGSSTVAPLVTEMAKRFEDLHPGTRIDVHAGGSSRGIADARGGTADIGMVSRSLQREEAKQLRSFTIARDGVALIVHRKNPVGALSRKQIVDVYTGQIRNWSTLGGPDTRITVVNKAEGRATLEVFLEHFGLESPQIRADVVVGHNEHAIRSVAGDPNAIGYVSIGTAEYHVGRGTPVRLVSLDGIEASSRTLRSGAFPLARPLNLVTSSEPAGLTDRFIRFCRSDRVHDIVESQFFVPADD